jgi:hypothetical protein
MPYTAAYAFDLFYDAINLSGDHRAAANTRRDWIVSRLSRSMDVLEARAIGSIPRYTALAGHADLDILVALHYGKHIKGKTPAAVLADVKAALGSGAGDYRRNGQAVTVTFASWPNIDVVPAARYSTNSTVTHFEIPDMRRGEWITTNPDRHAAKIRAAAESRGKGFRQAITMVKHWNRRQDVRLQSYHVEVIALQTECSWDEPGWAVARWMETAAGLTRWCWDGDADASAYLAWNRADAAAARLKECAALATRAWARTYGSDDDDEGAIRLWRSLFGPDFPAYG